MEDKALPSEEIRNGVEEKEPANENSSSKIWSEITFNRVKEVRQVIEISQEKGPNHHQTLQALQRPLLESIQSKSNSQIPIQQSQTTSQQQIQPEKQIKANLLQKESYFNQQLFSNNQLNLELMNEFKENQQIHTIKTQELFKEMNFEMKKQYFNEIQLKTIDWLLSSNGEITKKSNDSNFLRIIDLLYKKFIIRPFKINNKESQNKDFQAVSDIFKPDPIYGQKLYSLFDDSPSYNQSETQFSQQNSFKRNAPGTNYNQNYVSLVQNQSTNQATDYYQAIANNYVNGIRKQKYPDAPITINPIPKLPPQPLDKFKKYGPSSSGLDLPFDIQIPNLAAKKHYPHQYNLFQSTDDDKSDRFKQQRLVAKTFVKDGYGLQIVRNYMGPSMDGGTYNRAITTIIRESYKKIEDFLSKTCNMKIHCLTSSQFSLVKTPLVHCRNILRAQDLRTFFKYIAITYNFGKLKQEDCPTAQETLSLYNAILRGLSDRKTAKDTMHKPSHHKDLYYR